jgi:hypothetical protein
VLLLAMSCLQGRTQRDAFAELTSLPIDGVQLTPGNLPSAGFAATLEGYQGVVRFHHGFDLQRYRTEVWGIDGRLLVSPHHRSVHPPQLKAGVSKHWWHTAQQSGVTIEVMYPGYAVGTGEDVKRAMHMQLPLAVDVSHLFIMRTQGAIDDNTLRQLLDYPPITEVHVSHNQGNADTHELLRTASYGLSFAKERMQDGCPCIVESYFHKASDDDRRRCIELLN